MVNAVRAIDLRRVRIEIALLVGALMTKEPLGACWLPLQQYALAQQHELSELARLQRVERTEVAYAQQQKTQSLEAEIVRRRDSEATLAELRLGLEMANRRLIEVNTSLIHEAETDPLTSCGNRRMFEQMAAAEIKRLFTRDALSIMDKIVSFTNGELTYQNTLEHLNILDADYFFKLLDAMQQQQLADAMLLFDDINRKGFEGDMVLNAMAEFFRNLLVCKDEKVANLLEVVESFKDKYTSAAKKTSASYIISALNVLNEAEINYKQARNKRLHVELALIKLTYLQQALDLSSEKSTSTSLSTKAKAVQFRALKPMEVKTQPATGNRQQATEAKLMVEEPKPSYKVEQPITNNQNQVATTAIPKQTTTAGVKGGLSKLREKIAAESSKTANAQLELDVEQLKIAWHEYILKLRTASKHSVVSNFEMMECRFKSPLDFEIICNGNIQLGFLKQEKTALLEHIQHFFHNPGLNMHVDLIEAPEDTNPVERPLSTKEQFMKMTEKYPLVKELKDRLGLELDY